MKNKDIIMLGIIIGIGFFFIGAIISNIFLSSEEDLLPYKVSALIKLTGLGILTSSMIIGGIIVEEIDKNLKLLLLLLGLLLLIIYTLASPELEWKIPSITNGETEYNTRPTGYGVPGFEILAAIGAIIFAIILKKKRLKG
ncbi:MAG: hypothetical protein AYK22_04460 [Thermoplasmatales archaeon SG8-52-3]|nr:MAG: hypothetical protein AYK22_04460 [Thermoplasmatales archaeon SG8-52-3]